MTEWGTTLGLAALMIDLFGWLRADVRAVGRDLDRLNSRIDALGERMAHLEGLRESVTGRQAA